MGVEVGEDGWKADVEYPFKTFSRRGPDPSDSTCFDPLIAIANLAQSIAPKHSLPGCETAIAQPSSTDSARTVLRLVAMSHQSTPTLADSTSSDTGGISACQCGFNAASHATS